MLKRPTIVYRHKERLDLGWALDQLCAYRLKSRRKALQMARGCPLAIFANDNIGIAINSFGVFEKNELNLLFAFLRTELTSFSNAVALDVGAHIGNHSIYFSKFFAEVIAFEPNPKTYSLLKLNASYFKNIRTHNFGLGECGGNYQVVFNPINSGGSSLIPPSEKLDHTTSNARLEALDQVLQVEQKIKLIKLDTEGFEYQALSGARQTLKIHQPIVVLEQHLNDFTEGDTKASKLLRDLGYKICWIERRFSPKIPLLRLLNALWGLLFGRNVVVYCGLPLPKRGHRMLIAIPVHLQDRLLNTKIKATE